ncbi:hypothetical protein D3C76_1525170 [compost metagenome]
MPAASACSLIEPVSLVVSTTTVYCWALTPSRSTGSPSFSTLVIAPSSASTLAAGSICSVRPSNDEAMGLDSSAGSIATNLFWLSSPMFM